MGDASSAERLAAVTLDSPLPRLRRGLRPCTVQRAFGESQARVSQATRTGGYRFYITLRLGHGRCSILSLQRWKASA